MPGGYAPEMKLYRNLTLFLGGYDGRNAQDIDDGATKETRYKSQIPDGSLIKTFDFQKRPEALPDDAQGRSQGF